MPVDRPTPARDNLVARFLNSNLAQADLAAAANCDRTLVAKIVSGDRTLSVDDAFAWSAHPAIGWAALSAKLERYGQRIVPVEAPADPAELVPASLTLSVQVTTLARNLAVMSADGIDARERDQLAAELDVVEATVAAMRARLGRSTNP